MIPPLIHQTWRHADVPEPYASWAATVMRHHPTVERWLWTDEDNRRLIEQDFSWFVPTYDTYAHDIERVDAARYFILLRHGGLYLDLDIEARAPIWPLLGPQLSFSFEAGPLITDTVISNAVMAAAPGHAFFERLTRRLVQLRRRDVTHADVFANTGPNMLDRQVRQWAPSEVTLLGLDLVCPAGVLDQNPDAAEVAAVHHNTESWNVQQTPPTPVPTGYVLLTGHDVPGHDLRYVQVRDGDLTPLIDACDADPDAVGFNFNGFVKAAGPVERCDPSSWTKPGIVPWVCLKVDREVDRG